MPIKKYGDQQIKTLWEEFNHQELNLKDFCKSKDLPYTTIFQRFKRLKKKAEVPVRSASVAVDETVQIEIAGEATARTKQYLLLGKAIWTTFAGWASKRGMSLRDIEKTPIHEVVTTALEKEADYDTLTKENTKLRQTINIYASRVNPIMRLETGIEMFRSFLEYTIMMDAIGINVLNSDIGEFYGKMIESYLMGHPIGA